MSARHQIFEINIPPLARPQRERPSRIALRFLAGFLPVLLLLGATWPLLPRHYEATAAVILRTCRFRPSLMVSLSQLSGTDLR